MQGFPTSLPWFVTTKQPFLLRCSVEKLLASKFNHLFCCLVSFQSQCMFWCITQEPSVPIHKDHMILFAIQESKS